MEEKTRLALLIAGTALLLGALADGLLRVTPWGLNAAVWFAAFVIAVALLAGRRASPLMGEGRLMALPVLLFGASFAWRDSPTLKAMDGFAVAVCLGLMVFRGHAGRLRLGGATEYAIGVARAAWESLSGSFDLFARDIGWDRIPRGRWSATLGAVARGFLLAVPLLLVFGGLLSSADAIFADYVSNLARLDVESAGLHAGVTLACAWAVAGYMRGLLLRDAPPVEPSGDVPAPRTLKIGSVEIGVALTMMNLLFLTFVIVQVKYLFGGDARVQTLPGLTYAEYARKGFFELVWAASLAIPVLLAAHSVLDVSVRGVKQAFNVLAGMLVCLLLVVLASAGQRMRIYQVAYGMTELRFYTSAFMVWLAALFVWFCLTVLPGRRDRFAFGGLISAMAGVFALHVANPDATIARVNVARALEGKPFDVESAAALSADALPVVAVALPHLPPATRKALSARIEERWGDLPVRDWRAWSFGRQRAVTSVSRLLQESRPEQPGSHDMTARR